MSLINKLDLLLNNYYNHSTASETDKARLLDAMTILTSGSYQSLGTSGYSGYREYDDPETPGRLNSGTSQIHLVSTSTYKPTPQATDSLTPTITPVSGLAKFKMHMESVANNETLFPNTVRVYYGSGSSDYTNLSKQNFLETYGDYLMFDFTEFNETLSSSKYTFIGAYDNTDALIMNEDAIALQFVNNNNKLNLVFINGPQGNVNTSTQGGKSDAIGLYTRFMGSVLYSSSNGVYPSDSFTLRMLLSMYSAVKNNVDPLTDDTWALRAGEIFVCGNSTGGNTYFIVSKDIVDEFMVDFMSLTGYSIEYTGDIVSPTPPSSGITNIQFSTGVMTPAFDANVNMYSLVTPSLNFVIHVEGEGNTLKILKTDRVLREGEDSINLNYTMSNNFETLYIKGYNDEDELIGSYTVNITYNETQTILTNLVLKDTTKDPVETLSLSPFFNAGVFNYSTKISDDAEDILVLLTYENADTVTVNGSTYNIAKPFSIDVPDDNIIEIVLTKNDNSITYTIYLERESHEHGGGGHQLDLIGGENIGEMTGNGAIAGASQAVGFVSNYPPGFYGGSYIPNYRYVQPIYTTGNSDANFVTKKNANEQAVLLLNQIIAGYTSYGALDSICEAFIHYANFINDDSGSLNWRYVLPAINVSTYRPTTLTKNSITPKNNKCFTYPFSSLELNGYGTTSECAYEDFAHTFSSGKQVLSFDIFCKWFAGTSIQLVPVNYKNLTDNYDYSVAGPEMPVFPYTKNEYLNEYNAARNTRSQALEAARENADLAKKQNIFNTIISAGQGVASAGFAASMGSTAGAVGGGISVAGSIGSGIIEHKKIKLQLNQLKKSLASEIADIANRPATITNQNASPSLPMVIKDGACPFILHKCIRPEFLNKVDRFFTRFGYKTNRTGIPNIYQRPNFDYLECKNAVVGGNIPAEDKQALKEIFEHGITFWHYGSSGFKGVGDYGDADYSYNLAPTR